MAAFGSVALKSKAYGSMLQVHLFPEKNQKPLSISVADITIFMFSTIFHLSSIKILLNSYGSILSTFDFFNDII